MSILYKELTPDQKQPYVDAALKLKSDASSRRAADKAAKVQQYSPPHAYLLFCKERFPEVRAANPSAKLGDIMKLVGKQWAGLSEPEKQLLKARVVQMKASSVQ